MSKTDATKSVLFRRRPESVPRQGGGVHEAGQPAQVLTTKVGLQLPAGLTFENWELAGRQLSGIVNSTSWWLGDWLVYGKDHYSDRYERGVRAAGLQYQTLRNYAWVSRRFPMERRRAALSFQHHAELASRPVEEQERWLDQAEQQGWSTKQLRRAMRVARGEAERETLQAELTRRLAVPDNHLQWWHKAATQSGVELDQWVLATLDNAAEQVLEELQEQASVSA
ncbi:LmbU family transcriptional regulator [Streptomyces sp. NPDC058961]|uniref:LmbU family transcriptional regulator n=1 Tax=unclassified Streptomyces TaxID=2593676 RepID=UPI0018FE63CF|nr:LmbU family transcriptional regulator [Streptomyces sp. CB01201]